MGILDKPVTPASLGVVPKWKPNTAYTAGQQVVSPNNDIVSAVSTFTSGATYNAGNWNFTSSFIVSGLAGREKNDAGIAKSLQPFHAALAKRNTGTPVDMMMIGNSIVEGRGQTLMSRRLTNRFLEEMRRKYQPAGIVGGIGYTPAVLPSSPVAAGGTITDSPLSYAGTPLLTNLEYGLAQANVWLQTVSQSVTFTFTGTAVDIFWARTSGTGTFSYAVDGGATTNVNTNGTPNSGGKTTRVGGLTAGSHTITCTYVTGGPVVIEGFMPFNGDEAAGIRMWNGGHGGWLSGDFINAGRATWIDTVGTAQPSLVALCLVLNDYAGNITSATFKSNIQTLMTNIKAKCTKPPTFLLFIEPGRGDTTSPLEPYPNYVDKLYEIAASDPTVMVLDMYRRLGITPVTGITNANSGGLIHADKVHFSDFGAQWAADMMAAVASPN